MQRNEFVTKKDFIELFEQNEDFFQDLDMFSCCSVEGKSGGGSGILNQSLNNSVTYSGTIQWLTNPK